MPINVQLHNRKANFWLTKSYNLHRPPQNEVLLCQRRDHHDKGGLAKEGLAKKKHDKGPGVNLVALAIDHSKEKQSAEIPQKPSNKANTEG